MLDRIRTLIAHLHDVSEVNALTDRDLSDLGMNRDQVLAFLRMPQDVADRVTAMGAIFGIPEAALKRDHAQWVDLLSTCGRCADRGRCATHLAGGRDKAEATFCPNRPSFDDLAA
ncbi:MAG: DUF6455 family protein [Tabrizicola sp.]|uniref:DUF6455 family protein n=1 Tax=Tabrizicola sp. TaxID=2005166 RepID=UPI002735D92C|nr:DUF6455 family protein [Tabrizicola sp.]MDP3261836.1 DUF6455 family protein [Tabrizicola sp.]MDP3649556.1 DUF6455 family protein [Paracoccaceae bacterium]MDZ4069512.1 DUF6455 family protein [Tabrizicola sp.]